MLVFTGSIYRLRFAYLLYLNFELLDLLERLYDLHDFEEKVKVVLGKTVSLVQIVKKACGERVAFFFGLCRKPKVNTALFLLK